MKIISTFFCIIAVIGAVIFISAPAKATEPEYSPKLVNLGGSWFIRGENDCSEIKFDRKGRSDLVLFNRVAFIDKTDEYLYLTIREYQKTYTYQMNPIVWGKNYELELVAVGPNQPPMSSTPLKEKYTGIFRTMVDCQIGPPSFSSTPVSEQAVQQ